MRSLSFFRFPLLLRRRLRRSPNPASIAFPSSHRSPPTSSIRPRIGPLRGVLRPSSCRSIPLAANPGVPTRESGSSRRYCCSVSGGGGMDVVAKAVDEGSPARRFWVMLRREAVFAAYTPFVICLAAGRLELDTFRSYIAQDAYFLKAFAQAYDMAAECADDDDAKDAINGLKKAALDELEMHGSVIKDWGIDTTKEITVHPSTLKYTQFLLATASGKIEGGKVPGKIVTPFEKTKIAAYTVGAMTPCMRLYAHLGKELMLYLEHDGNENPYNKWIDSYCSKSFEASALQIEELLDKLCISLIGEELEVIEKLYRQAMKLEIEFFNSQVIGHPAVVPITRMHDPRDRFVLFSDFDLTCTVVDSSAILAEIAILSAPKDPSGSDNLNAQKSSSDKKNSFVALSKQYSEEYEQCIESLLPPVEAQSFDYESLFKSLEKLSDFERRANSRVIDSGLLMGMKLEDIKRAGERLNLQDGCKDFFQNITRRKELNADLHILSYCWCADLIRSAFSSVGCLEDLSIHANEFNYEGSVSTGELVRKIESPADKVNAFKTITRNIGSVQNHLSVYIGDSIGDLLCLLEADVGIVIGSSSMSLRRVGKHFGVSFVPLYHGLVTKQRQLLGTDVKNWKGLSGVLYTASSWSEIEAFLLGS